MRTITSSCHYCGTTDDHTDNCPQMAPESDRAMALKEWQSGHDLGHTAECIFSYVLKNHTAWFRLGYKVAKDEIDQLVDAAETP